MTHNPDPPEDNVVVLNDPVEAAAPKAAKKARAKKAPKAEAKTVKASKKAPKAAKKAKPAKPAKPEKAAKKAKPAKAPKEKKEKRVAGTKAQTQVPLAAFKYILKAAKEDDGKAADFVRDAVLGAIDKRFDTTFKKDAKAAQAA